jgi:hypothetical protein
MRFASIIFAALVGCNGATNPPGDEQMGTYSFHAVQTSSMCGLRDISSDPFDFTATLSHFRDGGEAFITINNHSHDGGVFDGQTFHATYDAPRSFVDCTSCKETRMFETITLTLLSKSQSDAVGGNCSIHPPFDPDAGIVRPGPSNASYDAVRACGTLEEVVHASPVPADDSDAGCKLVCEGCRLSYDVVGDRH